MKRIELLLILLVFLLGGFLRFFLIQQNPPGLYIDEVSIGLNAKSILNNGRDEHEEFFPLFFKAFGEYKMPTYIYATSGSMAILGKNEFSVRFPSALAGTLTIIVLYLFLKKIVRRDKQIKNANLKKYLPALAAFLLAISSWHIHFSRGGFEVSLGLFLYLFGLYLLLIFWDKKRYKFLILSVISLTLSMYTYNTFRIITPITLLISEVFFLKILPKIRVKLLLAFMGFFIFSIPLLQFSLTAEGAARFAQTSAFSEYKAETIPQKVLVYPIVFVKNYLSFFSLDFLFGMGDGNGRHQIPLLGLFYRWQFIFLVLGIWWFVMQKKSLLKYVVFVLLLLAPIPAAVARPSPHTLRGLLMVIPLIIIVSTGIIIIFEKLYKWKKIIISLVAFIAIYEFVMFQHYYYYHYPKVNALDWGAGFKKIVERAEIHKYGYDYVVVDNNLSNANMYFNFYSDDLSPLYVNSSWQKPKNWSKKKVLYIRPFYGDIKGKDLIEQIYLPGQTMESYSQFWKI